VERETFEDFFLAKAQRIAKVGNGESEV